MADPVFNEADRGFYCSGVLPVLQSTCANRSDGFQLLKLFWCLMILSQLVVPLLNPEGWLIYCCKTFFYENDPKDFPKTNTEVSFYQSPRSIFCSARLGTKEKNQRHENHSVCSLCCYLTNKQQIGNIVPLQNESSFLDLLGKFDTIWNK